MLERLRRAMDRLGKLGTTVVGLVIWEIGARVGLPGLDGKVLDAYSKSGGGGLTGLYDTLVGGAMSRGAILALGIVPYLSARIWMRLARFVSPALDAMSKHAAGRERIKKWTRALTVALAAVQSIGFALLLQNIGAAPSGAGFVIQSMLTLTAGAVFVMLVSEYMSGRLAVEQPDVVHEVAPESATVPEVTAGPFEPTAPRSKTGSRQPETLDPTRDRVRDPR